VKKKLTGTFIAVLLLVFVVYSQTKESDQSDQSSQLTLTMTPLKSRVLLLEPIPVKLRIENKTGTTLPLNKPLVLQRIKLSIEKPNGEVITPEQTTYFNARIGGGTGPLPSGAKIEKKDILEFNLLKWFDKPGQYLVKAQLQNGDSTLSSDWMTITVEEPTGDDFEAFQYLRSNVKEPSVILASSTSVREQFVEKFPETPYADYFRYALAQWYDGKDNTKATALYTRLKFNSGFIYAEEVNHNLKKLEGQKKNN